MATVDADLGRKDIVSPTKGRYEIKQVWVLDEATNKPVRVKLEYIFS